MLQGVKLLAFLSVTEDEIRRGILRVKDKDKHCYWFKRNIADLHERLDKGKARMFIDKAGDGLDKEAVSLLDKLRNNLKAKLSDSSVTEYDVKWSGEQCIEPQGNADHKAFIDKLCKDFYDTLVQMINRGIEEKKRGTIDDELVKEVSLHSTTCKDKSRVFYGREAVIDAIVQHIDDESEDRKRVLVVHGASGCGKTSIMAVAAKKIKDNHPDYPVILRFLGTTSESSSINKALYSICKQLCYFIGKKQSDIPVVSEIFSVFLLSLIMIRLVRQVIFYRCVVSRALNKAWHRMFLVIPLQNVISSMSCYGALQIQKCDFYC